MDITTFYLIIWSMGHLEIHCLVSKQVFSSYLLAIVSSLAVY